MDISDVPYLSILSPNLSEFDTKARASNLVGQFELEIDTYQGHLLPEHGPNECDQHSKSCGKSSSLVILNLYLDLLSASAILVCWLITMADNLYILYGSQTGNSEDIALDLKSRCEEEYGMTGVVCDPLNAHKKTAAEIKEKAKLLVIVCSTTGNGDAPENAETFWRGTKLRSAEKDRYAGLQYTVLGLGDTNYDKFCFMGKSLDKRLEELGGCRSMKLHCADEATGLEDVVDEWIPKIMALIKSIFVDGDSTAAATAVATPVDETTKVSPETTESALAEAVEKVAITASTDTPSEEIKETVFTSATAEPASVEKA